MKLRELFDNTRSASQFGHTRFRLTLGKDAVKTPHYVMSRVADMIEDRPSIKSGVNQIVMFTINDIYFKSKDKASVQLAEAWLQKRPWLKHEIEMELFTNIAFGTSYIEPLYRKTVNGQNVIDNFYAVPDPSNIFRNPNAKEDGDDYWILALSRDIQEFAGKIPKDYRIHYIKGRSMLYESIWGIGFPKEKYIQRVSGWSRHAFYGWSELCSAVDNDDILREILKNWALMAKYRALGKKIIGFYNENGDSVDPDEIEQIATDMDNLEEEDSLLVNKKFIAEDLTSSGQDSSMLSEIDYIRKDNTSATVPNYMTAFSEDGSFATAREARVPFSLRLRALQNAAVEFYNDLIVEQLRKAYPHIADDLTIDFGKSEVYSREELFQMYAQLHNMQLATGNEVREAAGADPISGLDTVQGNDYMVERKSSENTSGLSKTFKEAFNEIASISPCVKKENMSATIKESAPKDKKEGDKEMAKSLMS